MLHTLTMKQAIKDWPAEAFADALLQMGSISQPGRGRFSAETNRMLKLGLVTVRWLSMKDYVLVRTRAGNSLAKALFRQRGEMAS